MKRTFIFLIMIGLLARVNAQEIKSGGFGYFMSGVAIPFSSKVDQYLARPDVIGPSYSYPIPAVQCGGEGFAVTNKFLLGGGGYGFSNFRQSGDSASVIKSGGGGYFKAGYIFWSKQHSFMTAGLGFGGSGHSYQITNERAKSGVYFNQEFPIGIGETRTYSYGGTTFDFSYGFYTVISNRNEPEGKIGGFMIGFSAGCAMNIATGQWTGSESFVTGPPAPGVTATPYIRVIIGGGGFKLVSAEQE